MVTKSKVWRCVECGIETTGPLKVCFCFSDHVYDGAGNIETRAQSLKTAIRIERIKQAGPQLFAALCAVLVEVSKSDLDTLHPIRVAARAAINKMENANLDIADEQWAKGT